MFAEPPRWNSTSRPSQISVHESLTREPGVNASLATDQLRIPEDTVICPDASPLSSSTTFLCPVGALKHVLTNRNHLPVNRRVIQPRVNAGYPWSFQIRITGGEPKVVEPIV